LTDLPCSEHLHILGVVFFPDPDLPDREPVAPLPFVKVSHWCDYAISHRYLFNPSLWSIIPKSIIPRWIAFYRRWRSWF